MFFKKLMRALIYGAIAIATIYIVVMCVVFYSTLLFVDFWAGITSLLFFTLLAVLIAGAFRLVAWSFSEDE